MTFMLGTRTDEDIQATGDFRPGGRYSFGERIAAQAEETRILKDLNGRAAKIDADLEQHVIEQLGPYLDAARPDPRVTPHERRHDWIMGAVERAQVQDPERFGHLPTTIEDWEAQTLATRRAELEDAREVLDGSDGWTAELIGDLWAEVTTPEGAMMLMAGASTGAGIVPTMLIEGGMAAADELRTMDDQFRVADDLDLPAPRPLLQTGVAFGVGAGLGGVLSGAQRFIEYRSAKGRATAQQRPAGVGPAAQERNIERERERLEHGVPAGLELGEPVAEPEGTLGDIARGGPSMSDFDFSPSGNASPQGNRVGYVFGKLLALGYEPHIAAGLTGNIMQESGVGINTGAIGDNGNAFGMAQWNGPRRRAYLRYAQDQGKNPADLDTQIAYLHRELTTSEQAAAAKILAAPDARTAAAVASNEFWRPGIPHLSNRMAYAGTVMQQFEGGAVPKWKGAVSPGQNTTSDFSGYGTSRGYTGTGQVAVGDGMRIDVDYEVIDASLLRQAGDDLQPRDRSRVASDAWVNDTAARLDPAQLMPAPTADRGAPVVGPDNIIESGNGRVRAIQRTYDKFPDRADAYRRQIEATTGQPIPEGVERPVLIARRNTDLTREARRQMVVDAQDSGVARRGAGGLGDVNDAGAARRVDPAPAPAARFADTAYADGAASPEAQAADDLIEAELFTQADQAEAEVRQADADGAISAEMAEFEFKDEATGLTMTGREILDDLDADAVLDAVLDVCVKGAA